MPFSSSQTRSFVQMRERIKTLLDSKVYQKPVSLSPIYEAPCILL